MFQFLVSNITLLILQLVFCDQTVNDMYVYVCMIIHYMILFQNVAIVFERCSYYEFIYFICIYIITE